MVVKLNYLDFPLLSVISNKSPSVVIRLKECCRCLVLMKTAILNDKNEGWVLVSKFLNIY